MKVYIWYDKAFINTDKFADYLLKMKLPYLGTIQDCLDWIVYAPYFDLDAQSQTISYGLVKNESDELVYFYNYEEFDEFIKLNEIKLSNWYENIEII